MLEQNIEYLQQEQKKTKPKIEEIILEFLEGDVKNVALDFVSYLRLNKLTPIWASMNSWKCSFKSQGVCYIKLNNNIWNPSPIVGRGNDGLTKELEAFAIKENLLDFLWANPNYCRQKRCHIDSCAKRFNQNADTYKGIKSKIFGKEFENMCRGGGLAYPDNPDEQTIEIIKKLINFRRQEIESNILFKCK